ncbi:jg22203, partial [Pararge aegeria aegeria]
TGSRRRLRRQTQKARAKTNLAYHQSENVEGWPYLERDQARKGKS